MGKKPRILPSLFNKAPPRNHPWQHFFSPCSFSPKTLSFRDGDIFRTVNSVYFDEPSFTTEDDGEISVETVVRGVRSSSERLFFDPDETRSILGFPMFKESEVLAMESEDPYGDFRESMGEMVESHGIRDWEGLEELLGWYLKVNGKNNHAFIVEAFVDLLVSITNKKENTNTNDSLSLSPFSSSSTTASNYSSAISSFSSSPSSSLQGSHSKEEEEGALDEIVVVDEDHH